VDLNVAIHAAALSMAYACLLTVYAVYHHASIVRRRADCDLATEDPIECLVYGRMHGIPKGIRYTYRAKDIRNGTHFQISQQVIFKKAVLIE
jgi:hypothetical protein